ncbi:MAG: sulfatase-like hydrolase/transferase [Bryobacteraceae bacterium]
MSLPAMTRPNVVLFNSDDQRFDTIRALGNNEIHTPNLDSLVRRGMSFRNFYSQGGMVSAMCLPSRTMLMTGRSLFRIPGPKDPPGNMPLLPKAFERAGYLTYHNGKKSNTYVPASEAFQKTVYAPVEVEVREQSSEVLADAAIEYIRGCDPAKPFFAYLAPPVPHDPRVAPKRFMDMYDPAKIRLPGNFMPDHPFDYGDPGTRRDENLAPFPRTPEVMRRHLADYYAAITCLDYHVGRILAELERSGRLSNTIFVFTSDQGLAVGGRHGLMGKQNLYEEFKAPLIFAGPGIPRGESDALVYVHDLFPTLCGLAGIEIPAGLEGTSFAPVVRRKQPRAHEYIFGAYTDCQRMIRDRRYKLIWYPKAKRYQLFDLARDPLELDNLAEKPAHAARLEDLKRRLAEHQDRFGDKYVSRPAA